MQWLGRKHCSLCGVRHDRAHEYCRECYNAYTRFTRPKFSELSAEERYKSNVRSLARAALRRGEIKRKNCECCGSKKSQIHHEDYSKPTEVIWLCRPCHLRIHDQYQRPFVMRKIEAARAPLAVAC